MKMFLSLMILCASMLVGSSAFAAMSNENNPQLHCIPVGSPSADAVVLGGSSVGKSLVVKSARLLNGAAIAASDTDFVILELKKGSTVVAEIDSRAAHENGIANGANEAMNVVSAASTIASGDVISVNYNETDAGTNVALTGAVVCFDYVVK